MWISSCGRPAISFHGFSGCRGPSVDTSAHQGTTRYPAPSRGRTTNATQQSESECREQRGVHPSPVKLVSTGHFSSRSVATAPTTALLVDPSPVAVMLVGFTALCNAALISCFHSSRSGVLDLQTDDLRAREVHGLRRTRRSPAIITWPSGPRLAEQRDILWVSPRDDKSVPTEGGPLRRSEGCPGGW
jgi:hypothetical protein